MNYTFQLTNYFCYLNDIAVLLFQLFNEAFDIYSFLSNLIYQAFKYIIVFAQV